MEEQEFSTIELATLAGVTDRSIQRYAKDGKIQKVGHGRYQVTLAWLNQERQQQGLPPLTTFSTTSVPFSISLPSTPALMTDVLLLPDPLLEKDQRIRALELENLELKELNRLQQETIEKLQKQLDQQAIAGPLPQQKSVAGTQSTRPRLTEYTIPSSSNGKDHWPPANPQVKWRSPEKLPESLTWVEEGLVSVYSFALVHKIPVNTLVIQATKNKRVPCVDGLWYPTPSNKVLHALDSEGMRIAYLLHWQRPKFKTCPLCPHGAKPEDPATQAEIAEIRLTARQVKARKNRSDGRAGRRH